MRITDSNAKKENFPPKDGFFLTETVCSYFVLAKLTRLKRFLLKGYIVTIFFSKENWLCARGITKGAVTRGSRSLTTSLRPVQDQWRSIIADNLRRSLRDQEQSHEQNRLWGGLRRSSSMVKSLTLRSMIAVVVHISSMALWCFLEQSRRNIAGHLIESHD